MLPILLSMYNLNDTNKHLILDGWQLQQKNIIDLTRMAISDATKHRDIFMSRTILNFLYRRSKRHTHTLEWFEVLHCRSLLVVSTHQHTTTSGIGLYTQQGPIWFSINTTSLQSLNYDNHHFARRHNLYSTLMRANIKQG